MGDWRKEFQYLLDRKILSSDELAYLFGQIKSIIDSKVADLQAENMQQVLTIAALEKVRDELRAEEIRLNEWIDYLVMKAKVENNDIEVKHMEAIKQGEKVSEIAFTEYYRIIANSVKDK